MLRLRAAVALLTVLPVAGCGGDEDRPPSEQSASTSTSAAATSSTEGRDTSATLVLQTASSMPPIWTVALNLPYGEGDEQIGVAANERWGPEYATPGPNGEWWVLDTNKRRVARYDADGGFVGAVPIPGRYISVQLPHVLGNRWLWAQSSEDSLVADQREARRIPTPAAEQGRAWLYADGNYAYSDHGGVIHALSIDDGDPVFEEVDAMRSRDGSRFTVRTGAERPTGGTPLVVRWRDLDVTATLSFETSDGRALAPITEYTTDDAGAVHVLVYADDEGTQLAGYVVITPDGTIGPVEQMRNPFSSRDPGSPSHLRTDGDGRVSLVVVDEDALIVYRRATSTVGAPGA